MSLDGGKASRLRSLLAAAYELAKQRRVADVADTLARAALELSGARAAAVVAAGQGASQPPKILARAGTFPPGLDNEGVLAAVRPGTADPPVRAPAAQKGARAGKPSPPPWRLQVLPLEAQEQSGSLVLVRTGEGEDEGADDTLVGMLAQQAALALSGAAAFRRVDLERQKLEAVLAHATEGLVLSEADRVVHVTPAAETLLSTRPPRMGEPFSRFLDDLAERCDGAPSIREALGQAVSSAGRRPVVEVAVSWPTRRELRLQLFPIPAEAHTPLVGLLVADVSTINAAERMRREFLRNVSHELRTPLASIQAYAETLVSLPRSSESGQEAEFLHTIIDQSRRLDRLITNILHYSRTEAGAWTPSPQDLDVSELLRESVRVVQAQAKQGSVQLHLEGTDAPLPAHADREAVQAIVLNLLTNAVKYNRPGGHVRVRVRAHGGRVELTVADTGIGMDAEDQARAFERFYRAPAVRSHVAGAGIGLSLARSLVETMGGSIALSSRVSEGTTVTVSFPSGAA